MTTVTTAEPRRRPSQLCFRVRRLRVLFDIWTRRLFLGHSKKVFAELHDHLDAEEHRLEGETTSLENQSGSYAIEINLIHKMRPVQLIAKISALRCSLREMLVDHEYRDLMSALAEVVPRPTTCEPLLRWEALALLDRVYRRYTLVPKVEQERSILTMRLVFILIFVLLLLSTIALISCLASDRWVGIAGLTYVGSAVAGAFGATVSTLARLYKIDPRRDPLMLWLSLTQGGYSLYLAPFLGALFGVIFLLLMKSGIIGGTLFPKFDPEAWRTGTMLLTSGRCSGSVLCEPFIRELEGVLVWSFAAGWMERLVPDVLNRMSRYANKQGKLTMADKK